MMFKMILIDDELWTRKIIRTFGKWEALGINIVGEAEDGEEGLRLISEVNPDIIITDMNMPNMDGTGLLKTLKQKGFKGKIIVISGYDDYKYMKQAINSKAFEYLLKPIDAEEMNKVLKLCVDELYQDHQTTTLSLHHHFDEIVIDSLISIIKKFRRYIREHNISKINECLQDIQLLIPKDSEDNILHIRIVNDYLWPVIREELTQIMAEDDKVLHIYEDVNQQIKEGIEYTAYFFQIYSLMSEAMDSYKKQLKASKKHVSILAHEYIEVNFKNDISLSSVAKSLFTSKEYLSSAFKNRYGLTVGQYILKLKMTAAAEMLKSQLTHQEVSEMLAYNDVTYFYKVFKKFYGCSPGEYVGK